MFSHTEKDDKKDMKEIKMKALFGQVLNPVY